MFFFAYGFSEIVVECVMAPELITAATGSPKQIGLRYFFSAKTDRKMPALDRFDAVRL